MASRQPDLIVRQLEDRIVLSQERKMSRIFLEEIQVPDEKPVRTTQTESFDQTIREARKRIPNGSISDWSIFVIVAFGFAVLGLIILIAAIALLIHGANVSGDVGVSFQRHGYRMSVATLIMGFLGFVSGFIGLKDTKVRTLKSRTMAILAIIFGAVVLAVSLILTLIYFVIGGGG
jgi:hypothetical protein